VRCPDGSGCIFDSDCGADSACDTTGTCQTTCTDGKKNGTESDKDCGGGCTKCGVGRLCNGPGDCASGKCGIPAVDAGADGGADGGASPVDASTIPVCL
jgi:hypothetical protein